MAAETPNDPSRAWRARLVSVAKLLFAAALIGWLVRSGALDMGALAILVRDPTLFALNAALFVLGVSATTMRWRALLHLAGVRPRFGRLLTLQLASLFFNIVIPGNVGGDVIKALYVARDADERHRTPVLLIVFVERLLGLAGLVTVGSIVTLLGGALVWRDPLLRPLATTVLALGAATILGPLLFLVAMRFAGARIDRLAAGPSRLAGLASRLVASIRLFAAGPRHLASAFGFSMISHGLAMGYFTILARAITKTDVPYSAIATVFPLGLLTMILPISPSGLGVGHVAFAKLLGSIGIEGGATIFNVYLIGQIIPSLLGAIPYVGLRRQGSR